MGCKTLDVLVNKAFRKHLKRSDISTDIAELEGYVSIHDNFDTNKERKTVWNERRVAIQKFWGDIIDSLDVYLDEKGALTKPELIRTVASLYDKKDMTTRMTLNYVVETLVNEELRTAKTHSTFKSVLKDQKITNGYLNDFKDKDIKLKFGVHYKTPVYYKDPKRAKRYLKQYFEKRPDKDDQRKVDYMSSVNWGGYYKKIIDTFPHRKINITHHEFEEQNRNHPLHDDKLYDLLRGLGIKKTDAERLSDSKKRVRKVLGLGTDTMYRPAAEAFGRLYKDNVEFKKKIDVWLLIGASADRSSKPL